MSDTGDSGTRPKSGGSNISLAEAMARGREARRHIDELEKEEAQRRAEDRDEGQDTDEEEYNMMIAGLSEVVCSVKLLNSYFLSGLTFRVV